jgi:peroxiredoxin Q/BCP
MIASGEKAPDFTLYDHTGRSRTLSAMLADGPVVLFFFPIASSPICTIEACHFRDLSNEFAALGAQRVGISTDPSNRQARFAQQRAFDFPLLSDGSGTVSEQFGVRRGRLARFAEALAARQESKRGRHTRRRGLFARMVPVRRVTFVIDTDRTVLKVIPSELRAKVHADQALWVLENRKQPSSASPLQRERHRRVEPPFGRPAPGERAPEAAGPDEVAQPPASSGWSEEAGTPATSGRSEDAKTQRRDAPLERIGVPEKATAERGGQTTPEPPAGKAGSAAAEAKPAQAKPPEARSTEPKPAQAKPAEAGSTEPKPAQAEPAEERADPERAPESSEGKPGPNASDAKSVPEQRGRGRGRGKARSTAKRTG